MRENRKIIPIFLVILFKMSPTYVKADKSLLDDTIQVLGALVNVCWFENKNFHSYEGNGTLEKADSCFRKRTMTALDRILSENVIQVTDQLELVKYKNSTSRKFHQQFGPNGDLFDWNTWVLDRISNVLETHELQIRLDNPDHNSQSEGRHRRHRGAMPMLVFTTIAFGMILIPMGFQFLAVLGGKALLLAKLALILTAIQGLKKIATSDVNYGLYHLPGHGVPWEKRKWLYDINIPNSLEKGQAYVGHDASHGNEEFIHQLDPRF